MNAISDEKFKEQVHICMSTAFMDIRRLSRKLNKKSENTITPEDKTNIVSEINIISEGFHNIPLLLSQTPLNREQILNEIRLAGNKYVRVITA